MSYESYLVRSYACMSITVLLVVPVCFIWCCEPIQKSSSETHQNFSNPLQNWILARSHSGCSKSKMIFTISILRKKIHVFQHGENSHDLNLHLPSFAYEFTKGFWQIAGKCLVKKWIFDISELRGSLKLIFGGFQVHNLSWVLQLDGIWAPKSNVC